MACDITQLLEDAKCLQQCAMPGQYAALQLAALCQLAGGSSSGPYVLKSGDTMTGTLIVSGFGTFTQTRFLWANSDDTDNNTQPVLLEVYHNTTGGGGAVNAGVSFDMRADSDTTDRQLQARFTTLWSNATHATRTSELRLSQVVNGTTQESLRLSTAAVDLRNGAALQISGVAYFNPLTAYITGPPSYTLTNAVANVVLSANAAITITQPGRYMLRCVMKVNLSGATFAANETLTFKLRRTNNTAADLANSTETWILPITTIESFTLGLLVLPEVIYDTLNSNDVIQIQAGLTTAPSAGQAQVVTVNLIAIRIS